MIDTVADQWRIESTGQPVRAATTRWWHVPLLLAGLLVLPKSLGPRIARATWAQSAAVHLLGLLVAAVSAAGIVLCHQGNGRIFTTPSAFPLGVHPQATSAGHAQDNPGTERPALSWGEQIRLPVAIFLTEIRNCATDDWDLDQWALLVLGVHTFCWLAAGLLMPTVAGYFTPRARYFRCLKLNLWASTCIAPVMLLALLVNAYERMLFGGRLYIDVELGIALDGVATLLGWMLLVIRQGANPACTDGTSRWSIVPHCRTCGYQLTGLPTSGACPECSRLVASSIPERAKLPAWAQAHRRGRLRAWLQTVHAAIAEPNFFQELAVHARTADAINFALITCVVCGLPAFAAALSVPLLGGADINHTAEVVVIMVVLAACLALIMLGATMLAVQWVSRAGRRSPNAALTAGCYATSLALPGLTVLQLLVLPPILASWSTLERLVPYWGSLLRTAASCSMQDTPLWRWGGIALAGALLLLAGVRFRRGLRAVRFVGW